MFDRVNAAEHICMWSDLNPIYTVFYGGILCIDSGADTREMTGNEGRERWRRTCNKGCSRL